MIKRTNKKLKIMKKVIEDKMLSIKDAFRRFNKSHNGKMTFAEFRTFLREYSKAAKEI